MNYLFEGLSILGFTGTEAKQLETDLNTYIHELELFNSVYDLVGADTHDDIVIRHILDSLSAYSQVNTLIKTLATRQDTPITNPIIADIGSGGGLPGIPLALSMRDHNFKLIERMSRRCLFLENCKAILKLDNLRIENLEAERVPKESIDIAVFRAFRPLDKKMTRTLLSMLRPGGYIAAYKAKKEKILTEMTAIDFLVPEYKMESLTVPFLTDNNAYERHLVVIQKPLKKEIN